MAAETKQRMTEAEFTSYASRPSKLEGYLAFIQSIERNIDRRSSVNRFNLSILLPAYTAYAIAQTSPALQAIPSADVIKSLILFFCFVTSLVWAFQILRFREISRIKFEVLNKAESELGLNFFSEEAKIEATSRTIVSYTHLEMFAPLCSLAGALYLFFFV